MKTVFVNLLAIVRKFKFATFINIVGLSLSFAAFIIILMQVSYEYTFEDYHPDANRIYRGTCVYSDNSTSYIFNRPYLDAFINSTPHIDAATIINPYAKMYFTVRTGDDTIGYDEKIHSCYADITRVFNFEMIEGEADCLNKPANVLLPESLAKKMFGGASAVGERLKPTSTVWTIPEVDYFIVGGVYKDFPSNTQMDNVIYVQAANDWTKDDWGSSAYIFYAKLKEGVNAYEIAENFNNTFELDDDDEYTLAFIPIKDIYFTEDTEHTTIVKTGNKTVTNLLLLIGFLVIGIAAVNYINFSTSLAPMRMKSINTQKVLGCENRVLRRVLQAEAIVICFLSYLLSLATVYILSRTQLLTFVDADLTLSNHLLILTGSAILAVIIGLFAGLYPSYYMTSFSPALVLKGSHGLSPAGRKLRTSLICFQFFISYGLIIAALFILIQNRYMRSYNLGFDTDQIAIASINPQSYLTGKDILINKLKQHPGIVDVAFSASKFGGTNLYPGWNGFNHKDHQFGFDRLHVSWNFLKVMGIDLLDGHELTPMYEQGNTLYAIPNKKMYEQYEMEVNNIIASNWRPGIDLPIIGYTDNLNYSSLRYDVHNSCFLIGDDSMYSYSYIHIAAGANMDDIVSHIRTSFKEFDSAYPVEIEFFDSVYDNLYKKEQDVSKMIFLFSLLAAVISIVGVFGLVIFESQYRVKEIAIRKVHGATINSILRLFNSNYTKIVTGCFIFAIPFAWYGVHEWLKGFAYKTPMYWWVYAISFLVVALITLSTVTYQSWIAATKNPVDSIKAE